MWIHGWTAFVIIDRCHASSFHPLHSTTVPCQQCHLGHRPRPQINASSISHSSMYMCCTCTCNQHEDLLIFTDATSHPNNITNMGIEITHRKNIGGKPR